MKGKITKRAVDALMASAGTEEVILWDDQIKGFGIRARAGGAKTYILHYRAGKGRTAPLRKVTIGKHGSPWTPETAKTEAKRLLGQVVNGGDPSVDRATEKMATTIAELCDVYLEQGVAHKKRSTLRNDKSRIEHHIKPLIGRKRVNTIGRADVERLLTDVKERKTGAPELNKGNKGLLAACRQVERV